MKTIKIIKVSLSYLSIGLCLLGNVANAGKLYKWVDAKGNVSYQDKAPPTGSKILSEQEIKSTAAIRSEKQISQNTALPEITIYTIENCDTCELFITLMRKNRVPHIELSLKNDREAQSKILSKVGSLKIPSVLIGDDVFQKNTVDDFSARLIEAGYDIAVDQQATPAPLTSPTNQDTSEESEAVR